MPKVLSLALVVGALHVTQGLRRQRRQQEMMAGRVIAGVPVYNYELGLEGEQSALIEASERDWIVMMKRGVADEQIEGLCRGGGRVCKMTGHSRGVPFFEVRGTEEDLKSIIASAAGAVKFIEPDAHSHKIPDVQGEAEVKGGWGLERVGVPERPVAGMGVHVYVTDTGVRSTHHDFGGRVIPTLDYTRFSDDKECPPNTLCAGDLDGHGTHCAGLAAGENYGVASRATIHAVKILDNRGFGDWSWTYGAMDWIATKGERPAVVSMSIGGPGTLQAMKDSMDSAVEAGVIVVVAAGNENADACKFSPAFVSSVITVGATNTGNDRAIYSNFGSCTDIWAPGTSIRSASHGSDDAYKSLSGTSQAAPHVAGGAALILQMYPELSPEEVLTALYDNARTDFVSGLKAGDTNNFLWVGEKGPPPTPVPAPTPAPAPICGVGGTGPDRLGDCKCDSGLICYEGLQRGCPNSWTPSDGQYSDEYFSETCSECACK